MPEKKEKKEEVVEEAIEEIEPETEPELEIIEEPIIEEPEVKSKPIDVYSKDKKEIFENIEKAKELASLGSALKTRKYLNNISNLIDDGDSELGKIIWEAGEFLSKGSFDECIANLDKAFEILEDI